MSTPPAGTVGYVGLGTMGAPMLARLAAESEPGTAFGFDADGQTTERVCRETGARPCRSLAEIAAASDVLFTCLPTNDIVRAVYLGDDGLSASLRPGSVTVDCSTIGPEISRQVHGVLGGIGIAHLDASMLGSVKQAQEGSLSFVIGGEAAALDTVLPLLEKLGTMIRHCGGSGAGNQMKLLHQALVAGHAVAVGEALTLAERVGADLDIFYDIVANGTGFAYSRYFEQRVPRIRSGEFSPLFMLKFMAKDARLARAMGPPSGASPLAMLDAVIDTLEAGEAGGWGDEDFSAAWRVVQERFAQSDEPS